MDRKTGFEEIGRMEHSSLSYKSPHLQPRAGALQRLVTRQQELFDAASSGAPQMGQIPSVSQA